MKKIISVLLCVALLVSACSVAVFGIDKGTKISDYPVVVVCGYASSTLVKVNKDGSQKQVWGPDWNEVIGIVLKRVAELGIGMGALAFGNAQMLADTIGEEVLNLLGDIKCNSDGSSHDDVKLMFPTAAVSNAKAIYDIYGERTYQFEPDIMGLAETYTDISNVFNFNVDWRMGAVDCAKKLDEYIQEVKQITGKDKVNIFAVSHGGQVSGTYLTLFGYKQDVYNAVLTVPALQGAGMVYDMIQEDVHLNELNLFYFIENGLMCETDYHWLVEAQQLGFLDEVCNKLIPYLFQIVGNWGSIWDFCPTEIYENMKTKWLDETANAEIIKKSDYMHYTVMPQFYTSLKKCNDEYGMHISIVAGTDIDITPGWEINSDGIITTTFATGATCAPYGSRFADGYTQINDCNGKYKVSPAMTVDASTAYLPDNTWFVSGLFHGMTYWDMYTRELMMKLLLTDEIKDVYTDSDYPQFHESSNPSNGVWAKFNNSTEGYLSSKDSALLVTNTSEKGQTLNLFGIHADGADIQFSIPSTLHIAPKETVSVPFTGTLPAVSNTRISLIFSYSLSDSITPFGERVMSFTLMNGEKAEKTTEYESAFASTPFQNTKLAQWIGLFNNNKVYQLFNVFYNILFQLFARIK